MKRYKSVEDYIDAAEQWQKTLSRLRGILNATKLEETVKWGAPCYTYAGKNVVGLGAFKSYAGLWFFQGALLSDPDRVLINAQAGRTKAMRQWRFGSAREVRVTPVKAYVREAIALVDSGKEIKADRGKPVVVPPQLKAALARNGRAAKAFAALSGGKQREYADYVGDAKHEATKLSRIQKITPMITAGKGLNDKYRNC